ncbi:tRNA pseudouridine(55) synthase TruB [Treponema sp. OttesenSCG-928-L16]|nr:tRNA pseudouridine(55) synthase TruB [Treponema sp. OttesenSCG-928-L16]
MLKAVQAAIAPEGENKGGPDMAAAPLSMPGPSEPSGYMLIHKNPGKTSFETLGRLKRVLATRRIGHTGTLDKFAEGLLVVLVGRAAKLNPWFTGLEKSYEAVILFGLETDTLDPEGAIIAEAPVPGRDAVAAVLPRFSGTILQTPPEYSSVHIDGRRAHELARSGTAVEMKARPVEIHSLELLSFQGPMARISVCCSKGTYIRSLARDIALAAGSRAHLTELIRTKVGSFDLSAAIDLDAAGEDEIRRALRPVDRPVFEALGMPCFTVDEAGARRMLVGKPIEGPFPEEAEAGASSAAGNNDFEEAAVFRRDDSLVAVIKKDKHKKWSYGFVYARD